ncbi:hypothetical protein [Burkholderia sp. Ac-20353]|uniref:hypothetical protein n=1 Tax=Burkholderia sp. Ac-20353 TaxID=2703894 RepID=UPI00197CA564|nr:hypothetical protein [Burkholderia sp. Ac-20353]MBN3787692.1 hypothetical protein [Burkholderia sp. Ac-20353]
MKRERRWIIVLACGAMMSIQAGAVEKMEELTVATLLAYHPHQIYAGEQRRMFVAVGASVIFELHGVGVVGAVL